MLHRILRGTGIDGLGGDSGESAACRRALRLVRPMLDVARRDVLEYLAAIGQDYRTDATNEDTRWTRNRLRHELLPLLARAIQPDVDAALLRLGCAGRRSAAGDCEAWPRRLRSDCVASNSPIVRESRRARACESIAASLAGQPPIVVREVCKTAWRAGGLAGAVDGVRRMAAASKLW